METGKLKELDVKPGDVVECVGQWYSRSKPYKIGEHYIVNKDCEVIGKYADGATGICAKWRIISRASDDTPKLWRDMTDEEKGALLLAHHEGKVIEYGYSAGHYCQVKPDDGKWVDEYAYRVKPEPVREVVGLYGTLNGDTWVFGNNAQFEFDTHRITFDTIDGNPDCSTIRMEELD